MSKRKDKLYEGAVEWYCTLKDTEKKLIDSSFLFYEGGQYSNELKVNSAYMPDCIITAKNISDNKLKEIYWFFDKHGNPLTYAMPDKTIIEGKDICLRQEIQQDAYIDLESISIDGSKELVFQDIHFQKIRVTLTFFISPVLHCFFLTCNKFYCYGCFQFF